MAEPTVAAVSAGAGEPERAGDERVEVVDEHELRRLCEALDDHARSYLRWLSDMCNSVDEGAVVHDLRSAIATILTAGTLFDRCEPDEQGTLAAMLGRAARQLVHTVDRANELQPA